METIRRHSLAAFFILAFAISWGFFVPLALRGEQISVPAGMVFILAGGFGPLLSALTIGVIARGADGIKEVRSRILTFRVGIHWYALALLFPAGLVVAATALFVIVGGGRPDLATTPPLYLYVPSFVFVFLLGGGQEEPGWRGFALPRMQARLTALWSSVTLGLIWALWHLPLFFVPYSSQTALPFAWYVPHTIALSIIFTWLFNNTKGSVFLAMLLHAGLNAATAWIPLSAAAGALPQLGAVTLVEWAFVLFLLVRYGGTNLSRTGRIKAPDPNTP